jgi:hypothetical protein
MAALLSLLLSLAASFAPPQGPHGERDLVQGLQLARGWVTARLIHRGMPDYLWRPLVKGMEPGGRFLRYGVRFLPFPSQRPAGHGEFVGEQSP